MEFIFRKIIDKSLFQNVDRILMNMDTECDKLCIAFLIVTSICDAWNSSVNNIVASSEKQKGLRKLRLIKTFSLFDLI